MREQYTAISFDELSEIEISCVCGTKILVKVPPLPTCLNQQGKLAMKPNCAVCGSSIGTAIIAIEKFMKFQESAQAFSKEEGGTGREIRFRITAPVHA